MDKLKKTLITADQIKKLYLLQRCTFLPASFDKRFSRSFTKDSLLSEKQSRYLDKLFYKYRKQISRFNGTIDFEKPE